MSQIHPSEMERDHQFFDTLKRYAERLNEEKNTSLSYLQTINKLSAQLSKKDEQIQKLVKQNSQLRQKLNLYGQVMSRSRIVMNDSNINIDNNQHLNIPVNNQTVPVHNYGNMRMSSLIQKDKFTQSFLETRNQLEYLKQYDNQGYQRLQSKIGNARQSVIIEEFGNTNNPYKVEQVNDRIMQNLNLQTEKIFPIFQDFIIFKPTQNTNSSPDNLDQMRLIFSMNEEFSIIKKGNRIFQSISTYLCHNSGSQWIPQQHKTQISLNNRQSSNNNISINGKSQLNDNLYIYLSNSAQTLIPVRNNSKSDKISSIYSEFNPSLYFFGICYKSYTFEYINGKLHKVPLMYCFVSRYPFLTYWKQLLEHILTRLNIKNQNQLKAFRIQMHNIKDKSVDSTQGLFANFNENKQFSFELLQRQFKWKKLQFVRNKLSQGKNVQTKDTFSDIKNLNHQVRYHSSLKSPQNFSQLKRANLAEKAIPWYAQHYLISEVILQQLNHIFSLYNIELVIDVLLLLLLQIPIAVLSKNESLLQKFMLYFVYIIKPLKYPFPIIFNLPLNMSVVLQSPFPSFLGITDHTMIEPYIFERTVFDLDQKIAKSWPNIQFYNQSRESVVKWINRQVQKQQSQVSKLYKTNDIVKILISSSKYYPQDLKELRTYRKYFKKTQIWHIYSHQLEQKIN